MKKLFASIIYLMTVFTGMAYAAAPATLSDAKSLSASSGKPILLEFFRED